VTELLAPYPNPARRAATIGFRLARAGSVELELFDLAGHRVRRIESGAYAAGDHTIAWDGADQAGRQIPGGLYVVRMRTDGAEMKRKLFVAP
jgi:flagellar hook assembly protein FlgD